MNLIYNILLIDDNPGDVRLIQEMLSESNNIKFNLKSTARLSTGLESLISAKYDLLILDLGLPDSQGLETLTKIFKKFPFLPVIILTGLDDEDLAIKAVQQGAQDYLVKGHTDQILLTRSIRYAIERHALLLKIENYSLELQRNECQLRSIIKKDIDGIVITDKNGVIQFNNLMAEIIFDCHAEVLIGQNIGFPVETDNVVHTDIIRGKRESVLVEVHSMEIEWEGEQAYLVHLHDITENNQLIDAFNMLQKKFRMLLENFQEIIFCYELKPTLKFTYVSPDFAGITGYNREEYLTVTEPGTKMVHPQDLPLLEAMERGDLPLETPFMIRWMCKDGNSVCVEQYNLPIHDEDGMLIAIEGIGQIVTKLA